MKIPAKHLARILLELDEHRADLAQADQEHEHALTVWAVTNEERNKKLSEAIARREELQASFRRLEAEWSAASAMAEGWKKEHDRLKADLDEERRDAAAKAKAYADTDRNYRLAAAELKETRDALAAARQAAGIRATERLDHATETRDRIRTEADKVRAAAARHPSGPIILPSEPF